MDLWQLFCCFRRSRFVKFHAPRQKATVKVQLKVLSLALHMKTKTLSPRSTIRHISADKKQSRERKERKTARHRTYAMQNGNKNEIAECTTQFS
jgi:hypothetical protein